MKLNTIKITNFIQPRPSLWTLVLTNLILVCCRSGIANVQYSYIYKKCFRIFPQDKQYICVSISLRKSFLNLIIPRMGLLQKIVLPFTSVRLLPPAKKKRFYKEENPLPPICSGFKNYSFILAKPNKLF